MSVKTLVKEAFEEVMKDLGSELEVPMPTSNDMALGEVATKLAQAKGELNTILDRAAREGVIKKEGGKVAILNKNEYIKRIGNLPKQIKALQNQLEPQTNASNLE